MVRVSACALALCLAIAASSRGVDAFVVAPSAGGGVSAAIAARAAAAFVPAPLRSPSAATALRMSDDSDSDDGDSSSSSATAGSTLIKLPDSAVEVVIPIPPTATQAAYDRAVTEISKTITIPGFRKGAKIPPAVVENAVASRGGGKNALREAAVNGLVGQLVEVTLKDEHELDPIGQPVLNPGIVEVAETFVPGEALELRVKCDVWPEIGWKDVEGQEKPYYGLEGTYKRRPFNQERFDKAMSDLQERYATLSPAEDGTVLAMGDACTVDMVGYMADENGEKGEPLPNAASGDDVEVVLGEGRYMAGLVEGLLGARVGDVRTVTTSFPPNLRDKTLAGKTAIFDVTVKGASNRSVPEVNDEFAAKVKEGLTAEGLKEELRKAVDSEDAKEFVNERNAALGDALAQVMDVEVPDTLVTQQAREKFAMMMTDFRDQGMDDDEIKKQITPENFLKYKEISKAGIVRDFRISMAVDEIARLESVEVPGYQVDEQMEALKKEAAEAGEADDMDEGALRQKVEATLQRRLVYDFLADHADLEVEYMEEELDTTLLDQLAEESLAREGGITVEDAREELEGETEDESVVEAEEEVVVVAEAAVEEAEAEVEPETETEVEPEPEPEAEAEAEPEAVVAPVDTSKYDNMDLESKAFAVLSDLGLLEQTPDPDDPNYDSSADDEMAAENVYKA